MNKAVHRVEVLCDFDGTITNDDIGFRIIEAFGSPGWQEVEEAYQRGEKGSRQALLEIFSTIHVSEDRLRHFIEGNFHVDPYFGSFLDFCGRLNVNVTVLSDGFDFYIDLMFAKFGVEVPYLANSLRVVDGSLLATFPHHSACCGLCGNCKRTYAEQLKRWGADIIYIGDGCSDRCASETADIVFAKDFLAEHCRQKGINYRPFKGFADILRECHAGLFAGLKGQEEAKFEGCK